MRNMLLQLLLIHFSLCTVFRLYSDYYVRLDVCLDTMGNKYEKNGKLLLHKKCNSECKKCYTLRRIDDLSYGKRNSNLFDQYFPNWFYSTEYVQVASKIPSSTSSKFHKIIYGKGTCELEENNIVMVQKDVVSSNQCYWNSDEGNYAKCTCDTRKVLCKYYSKPDCSGSPIRTIDHTSTCSNLIMSDGKTHSLKSNLVCDTTFPKTDVLVFRNTRIIDVNDGIKDGQLSSDSSKCVRNSVSSGSWKYSVCDSDGKSNCKTVGESGGVHALTFLSGAQSIGSYSQDISVGIQDMRVITYDVSRREKKKQISSTEYVHFVYHFMDSTYCYLDKRYTCETIKTDDNKQELVTMDYSGSNCTGNYRTTWVRGQYQDWLCGNEVSSIDLTSLIIISVIGILIMGIVLVSVFVVLGFIFAIRKKKNWRIWKYSKLGSYGESLVEEKNDDDEVMTHIEKMGRKAERHRDHKKEKRRRKKRKKLKRLERERRKRLEKKRKKKNDKTKRKREKEEKESSESNEENDENIRKDEKNRKSSEGEDSEEDEDLYDSSFTETVSSEEDGDFESDEEKIGENDRTEDESSEEDIFDEEDGEYEGEYESNSD